MVASLYNRVGPAPRRNARMGHNCYCDSASWVANTRIVANQARRINGGPAQGMVD